HTVIFVLLNRAVSGENLFRRSLVARVARPARLLFLLVGLGFAQLWAPFSPEQAGLVRRLIAIGIIVLLGWMTLTALHIWTVLYLRRFKLESEDNLLARKHVTQSRILQRTAETLIILVTLSAALMTFDSVRQYGVSLLASAGAAGIVVGFALQPLLKNLVAGIQLAVTQPIRIDDALLIENEWGNVEEITASYVVVRLWDWRRLVVPLSYFLEKPFQNWTREGSALIGVVLLYTDFTVPVADLRAKLREILERSPLWSGDVAALQVTDFKERVMEIRMLMSATNSGKAFDLRCEVREKMIAYLQEHHPHALPRLRADWTPPPREQALRREPQSLRA
ncbi:MAG TPA: mechanosensitive ion channel family protein, partial [Beijerinckiaceae bacterium]